MFTGIIEGVGKVESLEKLKDSLRIWFRAPFSLKKEKLGDSVSINGCCLTITQKKGNLFAVDVSPESLNRSNLGSLKKGSSVNVERALLLDARLGGHLVQGHVDGVSALLSRKMQNAGGEKYLILELEIARNLRPYLVEKGSITLDGISLTVNSVSAKKFSVCVIPHTRALTTLTDKKPGDNLNIEVDILAKYVKQMLGK